MEVAFLDADRALSNNARACPCLADDAREARGVPRLKILDAGFGVIGAL